MVFWHVSVLNPGPGEHCHTGRSLSVTVITSVLTRLKAATATIRVRMMNIIRFSSCTAANQVRFSPWIAASPCWARIAAASGALLYILMWSVVLLPEIPGIESFGFERGEAPEDGRDC